MNKQKLKSNNLVSNNEGTKESWSDYEHCIAVDWSMTVMAIARLKSGWKTPKVIEQPSDVSELRLMLSQLSGKTILTIEETTTSHWLYLELYDFVDRIVICDPFRNRLLSDGPKTDKIDALKLCMLLRAGLLKEVYHTASELYQLRRLVSAYEDIVKAGVRLINQRASLLKVEGLKPDDSMNKTTVFIIDHINDGIESYRSSKAAYHKQFTTLCRHNHQLRHLKSLPGVGYIGAVKILATVIDAHRFPKAGHYLSYCGLVKLEKLSGGRSYGRKKSRYSHILKSVYKTAATTAIGANNPFSEYYDYLVEKGVAAHNARNAVARYIAKVSYGMLKSGEKYQPYKWRNNKTD